MLLLRGVANLLLFCSTVALVWTVGRFVVMQPDLLPMKSVRLVDAPSRVDAQLVERLIKQEVRGNFFTVDIDRVREVLVTVPWVRSVRVQREFPDRLAITFEEHQPLAHWNDRALVNVQGEIFTAKTELALPRFVAQDENSLELVESYRRFGKQLAVLGVTVTQIHLSPRHAWQLYLSNGLVLELGREMVEQRLERFIKIYPVMQTQLVAEANQRVWVDMRYRNGFAVRRENVVNKS